MIQKEIAMTPNDYTALSEVVAELNKTIKDSNALEKIMNKICSMSIWDRADLSISEELYGNLFIKKDFAWCIKDNQIYHFKILNRPAVKGDIVYITDKSSIMPDGYMGKYYRIADRYKGKARILGIDTYRDSQHIYMTIDDNQYIVLENLD